MFPESLCRDRWPCTGEPCASWGRTLAPLMSPALASASRRNGPSAHALQLPTLTGTLPGSCRWLTHLRLARPGPGGGCVAGEGGFEPHAMVTMISAGVWPQCQPRKPVGQEERGEPSRVGAGLWAPQPPEPGEVRFCDVTLVVFVMVPQPAETRFFGFLHSKPSLWGTMILVLFKPCTRYFFSLSSWP